MPQTETKLATGDWNPRWPWSPITGVIFTIILYLSQYLVAFLLLIYPLLRGWDKAQSQNWLTNSIVSQFVFVILAEALTVLLLWLFLRSRHKSFRDLGWNRWPAWGDLGKAIAVFIIYFIAVTIVLDVVTALIPEINTSQKQQLGFTNAAGIGQLIMTYIALAVAPPLVEETVFRGFLYGSLRKSMTFIQAAIATSFLFAIAHLELGAGAPPLWTAAIDVFVLSLGLVYLRVKTNSLWASVFLHCLKNTVAFLALFVIAMNF